jgi:DNA-binding LacI/PurR family transcriptional regulator
VDDDTAMLILDFLRQHRRDVPGDISLVGFDNTAEGARSGLTSYDFDFERFNYYVLRYLLEPERVQNSERQGATPPPGRIVMRGSVRRLDPR